MLNINNKNTKSQKILKPNLTWKPWEQEKPMEPYNQKNHYERQTKRVVHTTIISNLPTLQPIYDTSYLVLLTRE